MGLFEQGPTCTWEVAGRGALPLTLVRIEEENGKRLPEREKAYLDGKHFDDTGLAGRRFTCTFEFYNGGSEADVPVDVMYPDQLNTLIDTFAERQVGTLTLPTRGPVRCRPASWRRVEVSDERDYAGLSVTFVEDNEDAVTASSFTAPSARSTLKSQVEAAVFSLEMAGCSSFDVSQLTELASNIEGVLSAPQNALEDLQGKVAAFTAACDRIEKAFTGSTKFFQGEASLLMSSPKDALGVRQLRQVRDIAGRAVTENGNPVIVPRTFPVQKSLFDIATELKQSADDLMPINRQISDLLAIPPGTTVNVFAS